MNYLNCFNNINTADEAAEAIHCIQKCGETVLYNDKEKMLYKSSGVLSPFKASIRYCMNSSAVFNPLLVYISLGLTGFSDLLVIIALLITMFSILMGSKSHGAYFYGLNAYIAVRISPNTSKSHGVISYYNVLLTSFSTSGITIMPIIRKAT